MYQAEQALPKGPESSPIMGICQKFGKELNLQNTVSNSYGKKYLLLLSSIIT